MACVTACPSGVQYAPLIEATRGQIDRRHERSFGDRAFRNAIFAIFPFPARLRVALSPLVVLQAVMRLFTPKPAGSAVGPGTTVVSGFSRTSRVVSGFSRTTANRAGLVARIRAMLTLAPSVSWRSLFASVPERTPAVGPRRLTVGLLTGCVQRIAFPQVNEASVRVLSAEGCDVVAPADQGCCGALALHAGRLDEARIFARRTIETFERAAIEKIAVNAAGCGSSMKEYGQLLADDPAWAERARSFAARVRDVTEVIVELGEARAPRHPLAMRVAYHDACHLAHAQGIRQPPRDLLTSIPGIELLPFAEQEICCGSAGIYNLVEPEPAAQLGDRKVGCINAVRADLVATANPGCTLQMAAAARRAGGLLPIRHPVEILDASIAGRPASCLRD
jgi:glycolate oxidase iron-sulfur subunit